MTSQVNSKMTNKIQNYTFKNPSLLEQALTHSSYSKNNYERLEFLGDSILDLIVGEYLFNNSAEHEGVLSKLRAQFVSQQNLVKVFDRLNIEKQILLGKSFQGGITDSLKGDIVEAIIAAVYLDSDFEQTKKFVQSIINLGNYKTMKSTDYKSQLQEKAQAKKQKVSYKTLSRSGQSHSPLYEVGVLVDGKQLAKATASSKNKAEQDAAKIALGLLD